MSRDRMIIASALLAAAVLAAFVEWSPHHRHDPAPSAGLSLRGKWIGPRAAEDAAAFAGLCHGIAAALEVDGSLPQPRISSGVQIEDLKIAASQGRFLPRRLTTEQPHATAAAGKYLDDVVGTSGGPLDATTRAKWAAAYRELAAAAEEAVK